jgi:glycosyltransferase involved in cell wall biosynthesis
MSTQCELMNKDMFHNKASWNAAFSVSRKFVRFINPEPSPGEYLIWPYNHHKKKLSIIIPTLDSSRDGYFSKLIGQVLKQNFSDFELIVVRGDPRQGRAINTAAAFARGKYLLILDDDTSLPDPMTFSKLVALMEKHPDIGIAGGNNVVPDDATLFVRRAMYELPRRSWDPVPKIIDSDLAEHPCMIMSKEGFKLAGGENELIPRGLDPYLRQEFRKLGKRVVVVPGVIYHHLPPDNFSKLLRQFYRNGRQAAYTHRNFPQWMIETPQKHGRFRAKQTFFFRVVRFPFRLLEALVTGKPIWFLCEVFYALGFASECIASEKTL